MNTASKLDDETATPAVLDFSTAEGGALNIVTGGDPVALTFDKDVFRVAVSDATITISEFIYVRGGFALEKSDALDVTDLAGVEKEVSVLTLGLSNAYVFAGVGGPYWNDSNDDGVVNGDDTPNEEGALGVALGKVNVALALFKPTDLDDTAAYTALKVQADSATLVGLGDLLTIEAHDITVSVNTSSDSANPDFAPAVIDFSQLEDGGLEVATGNDSLTLDYDSRLLSVLIGDATFAISEFIYVRGSFALEQGRVLEVATTADGSPVKEVTALTLGTDNAYVFAGIGGPYWTDSDGDGKITAADTPAEDGAVGVAVGGVKLGLALFQPTDENDTDSYFALSATAESAKLVGFSGLTLTTAAFPSR